MVALYDTWIRSCLPVHLVCDNLAGGAEKFSESPGLFFSWSGGSHLAYVFYKFGGDQDQFESLMATTLVLGIWFVRACAWRLLGCHHQCQVSYTRKLATTTHQRLALAVIVVVRWSDDVNIILLCLGCFEIFLYTLLVFYNNFGSFSHKKKNMEEIHETRCN
jgi:hypothetical protein